MNAGVAEKGGILIDCREFVPGRLTGIGRVLVGLIGALSGADFVGKLVLAVFSRDLIPPELRHEEKITFKTLPRSFLKSEKALTKITKQGFDLFISPYPKLPLFGCYCPAVNTIHDILDITHPAYRGR